MGCNEDEDKQTDRDGWGGGDHVMLCSILVTTYRISAFRNVKKKNLPSGVPFARDKIAL